MWQLLIDYLDKKAWPQKLVGWLLARRKKSSLSKYLFPISAATHAVSLGIASPLIPIKDLFNEIIPKSFGSWKEYTLDKVMIHNKIAVAALTEVRSQTEFFLILPVHKGFDKSTFLKAKKIRLTCEAERSHLLSVRLPNGYLLAAGILELIPTSAYSTELTS